MQNTMRYRTLVATFAVALSATAQGDVRPTRLSVHQGPVAGVVWSADATQLLSCGEDGKVQLCNVADGSIAAALPVPGAEQLVWVGMSSSADAQRVVAIDRRGVVAAWQLGDRTLTSSWRAPFKQPACIALRPDGEEVAIGSVKGDVVVCEVATGKVLMIGEKHKDNVLSMAWRPDGKQFASGDSAGSVRIWADGIDKPTRVLQPHRWFIGGLAWSPDGVRLASCSKTRMVHVHDMATAAAEPVLAMDGATKLYAVAFSPDGKWLASGGREDYVKVWHAADGELAATLQDPQPDEDRGFQSIVWSPKGDHFAVPHHDGVVRVWPAASLR